MIDFCLLDADSEQCQDSVGVLRFQGDEMTTATLIRKKESYHHGNLREALTDAAIALLETHGVQDVTLRAIAREVGVSQAAPYSHFRDKDDLLAAVAEIGFQRLALKMAGDAAGAGDTRTRIRLLISSYLDFARKNPALFHLMFSPTLGDAGKYPTLALSAGKSYSLFSSALAKRTHNEPDGRFLAVALWSMCQGMTALLFDRGLKPEQLGAKDMDDLVTQVTQLFGNGLD